MEVSKVRVMQNRPESQQVGVGIQDQRAIDARNRLEHGRRKIQDGLIAKQVVKLILGTMTRCGLLSWSRGQQIGFGNKAADRVRVVEQDEKPATAVFCKVQGGNEQLLG